MAAHRRPPPTQERLKELLHYDAATGAFTWKANRAGKAKAGAKAGWDCGGYIGIGIDGKWYLAHVLAWIYVTSELPSMIDHADRNGLNNKFSNLRVCTNSTNTANSRVKSSSHSGLKGIEFDKRAGKYRARICCRGERMSLGSFPTAYEAHTAYSAKAKELFGEFARTA
jgi:HNH endonuclease/AP2 domain